MTYQTGIRKVQKGGAWMLLHYSPPSPLLDDIMPIGFLVVIIYLQLFHYSNRQGKARQGNNAIYIGTIGTVWPYSIDDSISPWQGIQSWKLVFRCIAMFHYATCYGLWLPLLLDVIQATSCKSSILSLMCFLKDEDFKPSSLTVAWIISTIIEWIIPSAKLSHFPWVHAAIL
jgi:hypothetical protein